MQRVLREEAAEHEAGVEEVRRGKVDEEGEEFLGTWWKVGYGTRKFGDHNLGPRQTWAFEYVWIVDDVFACVLKEQAISHPQGRIIDRCMEFHYMMHFPESVPIVSFNLNGPAPKPKNVYSTARFQAEVGQQKEATRQLGSLALVANSQIGGSKYVEML